MINKALVFLLVLPLSLSAFAEDTEPIESAAEIEYPPFSILDEEGRADGFAVDLLRVALQKMGREVDFRVGPWKEVHGWLEQGEIDALPLVGRTPEREPLFDFTFPYLTMHGALVVQAGNDRIREFDDLRGKSVAVMEGDNAEEFLRREERDFEIVTTPTFADAMGLVAAGECDAVVIQRLVALRLLREKGLDDLKVVDKPLMQFEQDFCFAVQEGDAEMLALLNEGLALVKADGTYRRLYNKWFSKLLLPPDRPIIVGGDHNYPPFEYLDEKGRPSGFNVDIIRAVARETGLNIKIELKSWDEIMRDLANGEVDAIEDVGRIEIETWNADLDQEYCIEHVEATPGKYIVIIVSDDGCGMDAETQQNIFEPFYTTKGSGEGTGLGLSTVYGIVKQNGGFLNVYSEVGKGTTFRIYLPSHSGGTEPEPETEPESTAIQTGGSETILLVEDEDTIRKPARIYLEKQGYSVLESGDPKAAIDLIGKHGGEVDLLVTDVVMPGMNGREMAEKIVEREPDMKVIYMSGYTANVIMHHGVLEEGTDFLQKPFTHAELASKIRQVLDD